MTFEILEITIFLKARSRRRLKYLASNYAHFVYLVELIQMLPSKVNLDASTLRYGLQKSHNLRKMIKNLKCRFWAYTASNRLENAFFYITHFLIFLGSKLDFGRFWTPKSTWPHHQPLHGHLLGRIFFVKAILPFLEVLEDFGWTHLIAEN